MLLIRLIRYEIYKIIKNRVWRITFLILFLLNLILSAGSFQDFGKGRKSLERQKEACRLVGSLTGNGKENYIKKLEETYGYIPENGSAFPASMASLPGVLSDTFSDMELVMYLNGIEETGESLASEKEYILSMAKAHGRKALKEEDAYEIRLNKKIILLYRDRITPVTGRIQNWKEFYTNQSFKMMSIVLLLVLFSAASVFSGEHEQSMNTLLVTAKLGTARTGLAKNTAIIFLAAVITVLFSMSSITVFGLNSGLSGNDQPAAAIEGMEAFPFSVTVRTFFLLSVIGYIFTSISMGILYTLISSFCKKNLVSYALCTVLTIISFLLLFFSKERYLTGPLFFLRPLRIYASYQTLNIFSFPIWNVHLFGIEWTAVLAASVFISSRRIKKH